ncbi:unnamed protein product [Vitrella brassicaformis CCMP3155]|uniref:Uncharacterized protein n=1 Tax=Vitrella brassicaformis (strain CCMP3155) TaxID=1169540 RepID=A0A0G4FWJ2_VITBC|nr:unnamed protein product [Vitrella brassicaformis CCMP3155]|eukprot:CEM19285.1 unnamed protein product [Vitrella brassicaformis CCMP3155]
MLKRREGATHQDMRPRAAHSSGTTTGRGSSSAAQSPEGVAMHSAAHAAHHTHQHRSWQHRGPGHPPLPPSIRPARAPAAAARRPSVYSMTYEGRQIKVATYATRDEAIAAKNEEARRMEAAEKAQKDKAKRDAERKTKRQAILRAAGCIQTQATDPHEPPFVGWQADWHRLWGWMSSCR